VNVGPACERRCVAKKAKVALPLAPLPGLAAWLQAEQTPGVVIGALAVSLQGRPRVTRDVDVLVLLPEDRWPTFLKSGRAYGFVPRDPDVLAFAKESRVLLLRHQPSAIDVDVALGNLPFEEEAVARATIVQVGGASVPLATPEDLVIMKALAARDQDWLDIEGLLAAHPRLDLRRVRRWVREFANALDAPEIYGDLVKRLRTRKRRKGK
jgi:hypothetical protein